MDYLETYYNVLLQINEKYNCINLIISYDSYFKLFLDSLFGSWHNTKEYWIGHKINANFVTILSMKLKNQ